MPLRKHIIYSAIILIILGLVISSSFYIPAVRAEEEVPDPSYKEIKAQEGYIINLKDLIKKSKNKIERVDEELQEQARKRRNQQREEKAREYYEKAMRLHEEGKLEEAQEYWEKAIKITEHSEMKDYISESVKKSKRQEDALKKQEMQHLRRMEVERGYSAAEVEKSYQEAVSLFKQKKFLQAQVSFERVDEMFPDHKATRSYLMIIDQEIDKEQQQIIEEKLREEAIAKQREKEQWRRELEQKEKERQQTIAEQAEALYIEALTLYKNRQFERAKDKFKEVEWVHPTYKAAQKYLSHIDKDIEDEKIRLIEEQKLALERQAKEEKLALQKEKEMQAKMFEQEEKERIARLKDEAEFVYDTAVSLYKNKSYIYSKEKFEEVQKLFPGYKASEKYLRLVDKKIAETSSAEELAAMEAERDLKKALSAVDASERERLQGRMAEDEQARLKELQEKARILYGNALDLYQGQLYPQALEKFLELESVAPDYKSTEKYISKIKKVLGDLESQNIIDQYAFEPDANRITTASSATPLLSDPVVQQAQMERNQKFAEEAEMKYNAALNFYKDNNFISAKHKFIQVEAVYPGYKDTLKYLAKIDEKIETSDARMPVQRYEVSTDNEKRKMPGSSKPAAEVKTPLKKVEEAALSHKEPSLNEQLTQAHVQDKFQEAVRLYKDKQYAHAKLKFLEVLEMDPNYKSKATRKYLDKIYTQIEKEAENAQRDIETHEWEIYQDERVALLRAKEEHLEELKGERYQEFKAMIEKERKAIEEVEKERQRRDALRRKNVKSRYRSEEAEKEKEQRRIEKLEALKSSEEKEVTQKREMEEKKRLEQEEKERIRQEKEEELAKIKEENLKLEQLKEEQRQKDLEAQRIAREVAEQEEKMREREMLEVKKKEEFEAQKQAMLEQEAAEKERVEQRRKKAETIEAQKEVLLDKYEMKEYKQEVDVRIAKRQRAIIEKERARKQKELKKRLAREQSEIDEYLRKKQANELNYRSTDVEEIYKDGVDLYHLGNFMAAKGKFSMVNQMKPGYKSVESFLEACERRLTTEEMSIRREVKKEKIKETQEELDRQKEEERLMKIKAEEEARQKELAEKEKIKKEKEEEIAARKKAEEQARAAKEQAKAEKKAKEADKQPVPIVSEPEVEKIPLSGELKNLQDDISKKEAALSVMKKVVQNTKKSGITLSKEQKKELKALEKQIAQEEKALKKLQKEQAKKKSALVKELEEKRDRQEELAAQKEKESKVMAEKQAKAKAQEEAAVSIVDIAGLTEKERQELKAMEEKVAKEQEKIAKLKADEERKKQDMASQLKEKQASEGKSDEKAAIKIQKEQEKIEKIKAEEKENQLEQAREFEEKQKQELKDAQEIKLEQERTAKELAKERKKLEAEKAKLDKRRQKEELKKIKRDLDQLYSDAVGLYRIEKFDLSHQKFKQFEDMLAANNAMLESSYLKKMRKRLDLDREKLNVLLKRDRMERMTEQDKKQEELRERMARMSQERSRELNELKNKINADEERLAKEREKEEERLRLIKEKEEAKLKEEQKKMAQLQEKQTLPAKATKESKVKSEKVAFVEEAAVALDDSALPRISDAERKRLEEQKREELKRLVKEREEQLRKERERIQAELQSSIEELYQRAINLHKSGMNAQAIHILEQVEELMPGYKKTGNLIEEYRQEKEVKIPEPPVPPVTKEKKSSKNKAKVKAKAEASNEINDALDAYYDQKMGKAQTLKSREDLISDALNSVEAGF